MTSSTQNVIPLLRSTSENRAIIQGENIGLTKDLACLKELSLQLQTVRRLCSHSINDLNAICTSEFKAQISGKMDQFIREIEDLQVGTDALINAITKCQLPA